MMDILELHEMLHKQPIQVTDLKSQVNQNIHFPDTKTILTRLANTSVQVKKEINPIPWGKWLLVGGAIAIGIYLLSKIPKDENYQSLFERRRNRPKGPKVINENGPV